MEMTKYKLGDIAKTGSGGTPKSTVAEYYENGNIPWINSGELNNPFISTTSNFITQKGYDNSSAKLFPPQTVLLAMYGATAGKASLLEFEACTNQAICAIMPNQDILLPRFLKYKLDTMYNYLVGLSTGSARDNLSQDGIKALELCIPPLSEQKKIASVLSALDDKIALNKKMNQKLEAMAKRLYDYWFVQFDFPDKNGRPYKTSGGPMTYNPTLKREIPAGWEVDNLYAVADYINGLACQNNRPKSGENALPVIKIREMSEGITSDTEEVSENIPLKYIVENGDILFSWSATLMVMIWADGKGGLNQHIFKVVPKDGFPKEYVYQLLSDYVVNFQQIALSRKTTMGHITSDHINLSRVVLPPEKIMEQYAEKVRPIFDKIVRNQVEYRKLTALRDKLLPLLMNGQVVVR